MKRALVASLFLMTVAQAAPAGELGRLFHTPEQRKALNAARASPSPPPKPASVQVARKPDPAPLEGYVVRSDGLSTVWIDGRAVRMRAATK
jgi:hypothetical protein